MSLYELIRRTFLSGDPEKMHDMAIHRLVQFQSSAIGRSLLRVAGGTPNHAPMNAMGLTFSHPVGIAAGFDKDAEAIIGLQELGFSYVEIGTVTPRPQPGNPFPRIWRFPDEKSIVNAMGFPGKGMHVIASRLRSVRASGLLRIPIGINLGKNLTTPVPHAAQDYTAVLKEL
ncbi:dihydroorotate dehydrogenase (quinone), partial [bacterium]|nr:dihydroorotate dehydrogenase (quinone) [bacterium]